MIADSFDHSPKTGSIGTTIHMKAESLYELLNFISAELPIWRDRSDRECETAEERLTSQLCAHLNTAARMTEGWDILQFRTEIPDEGYKNRSIDLAPSPCGSVVCVEGRRCTEFDMILPIECKRLPTPRAKDRDEREYVFDKNATKGGIQRFKLGFHGSRHNYGAMIAYIQQDTAATWYDRVTSWIKDLVRAGQPDWSKNDLLDLVKASPDTGVTIYRSMHHRNSALTDIELRHLWLEMS